MLVGVSRTGKDDNETRRKADCGRQRAQDESRASRQDPPKGSSEMRRDCSVGRKGTIQKMLSSSRESREERRSNRKLDDLPARFRDIQERGAKHAADAGVDVKDIPAMVRQQRGEASNEELAEAEEILSKSLGRPSRR